MVGVGGGVPREKPDIRLGDIVVSKPSDTSSGVIQYDYGKTLQTGRFYRTGSLNKPPPLLLKAIAQMESDYMLGKASISNIMASSLEKEEVRKQFPRPSKDQLFQRKHNHVHDRPDCATCDTSQVVGRPERMAKEPHIHYGLIASGNQVMKDASARDQIAQELDILCFKMEATRIMDKIPSLVIQGICDYCDSYKHKEWQPYAAFVAATYAKAVLMQVPFWKRANNLEKLISTKRHWMVPF
jgi:nucleoside phosphorylase